MKYETNNKNLRNILIIELASTSTNYVNDAIIRGLIPVVFYWKPTSNKAAHTQIETYQNVKKLSDKIVSYEIDDNYSKILKLAKKINPLCVLSCTDRGTTLREKLCVDLKLPHNSIKNIDCYTDKFAMHNALKKNGLRYIKSKIIHNVEEGLDFFENENLSSCVIKQVTGTASFGLHICEDKESLVQNLTNEFNSTDFFTNEPIKQLLIQEKINGIEYVVNTISNNGDHAILSLWRYNKVAACNNSYVYDFTENLHKLEQGSTALIKYAYSVLDAIGYKNGPVHGEYMVDENGPVLIEVNCRVMGGASPAKFLDVVYGHHDTDIVLEDMLVPGLHEYYKSLPYYPFAKAAVKDLISNNDAKVISVPLKHIFKHLASYNCSFSEIKPNQRLKKTIDLFSSPGKILLANENRNQLMRDLDFIKRSENNNFELFYQTIRPSKNNMPKNMKPVSEILDKYCKFGSTIILSNNKNLKISKIIVDKKSVKKVTDVFNTAIFDYNFHDDYYLPDYIDAFYDLLNCVKTGGRIIIPERSFWFLNNKESYVEAMCECVGLSIDSIHSKEDNTIVAWKQ